MKLHFESLKFMIEIAIDYINRAVSQQVIG